MSQIRDASVLQVNWWKSSASAAQSDCVEFGIINHSMVAVRDSKRPKGAALLLNRQQVTHLIAAIRSDTLEA
ncbi:DUF397 domain-containing protein [Streptomyces sp. NPDC049881]|uniref:DUF397 domain-containing protein n=1 Tax=Streptomyces sp. NPDC049881 TaxID=3155778 RepID=UPI00341E9BC7